MTRWAFPTASCASWSTRRGHGRNTEGYRVPSMKAAMSCSKPYKEIVYASPKAACIKEAPGIVEERIPGTASNDIKLGLNFKLERNPRDPRIPRSSFTLSMQPRLDCVIDYTGRPSARLFG
eukprot:914939-Pelagomonas_calceolata.AAC.5